MVSLQSPLYPQSECVATFQIDVPLQGYTKAFLQPATLNMCRLSWQNVDGTAKATPWFSTSVEMYCFNAPQWTERFIFQVTSLSPCLDEPTEWTDLQLMPKKDIQSLSGRTSQPIPTTYRTEIIKPLKKPISTKPLVAAPTYQSSEVYWEEGQGYISPNGTRVSYTELRELNAGALARKSEIDFHGEPQTVAQLLPTAQNIAYWCGFKNIQFLTE